jgi:hypothetical protein
LEHGLKVRFIEPMECLPVANIAEGHQWTYELLCSGSHKISYVAQEVMLRDSSGSAHLLAGALRARNIISTNVKLRSPSRRRITIADNRPATASMSASPLISSIDHRSLDRRQLFGIVLPNGNFRVACYTGFAGDVDRSESLSAVLSRPIW